MTHLTQGVLRAAFVGLLLSVVACGSSDVDENVASAPSSSASAVDPQEAQSSNIPTSKPSRPADPLAPATRKPVVRVGKSARPTVDAKAVGFAQKAVYPDGVTLEITRLRSRTVSDQGPGGLQGPATSIDLRFENKSAKSVELNEVVASLDYGLPARTATPVYTSDTQDFSGTLKPGRDATARYTYLVAASKTSEAKLTVDFDSTHVAAVFMR